jgi:hypothetical protein
MRRHVTRGWSAALGGMCVQHVDESHAVQAAPGDLLLLKGNRFPGAKVGE